MAKAHSTKINDQREDYKDNHEDDRKDSHETTHKDVWKREKKINKFISYGCYELQTLRDLLVSRVREKEEQKKRQIW